MEGETWIATHHLKEQLAKMRERREMFVLREVDNLHPFVYQQRLAEIDREIESLEDELAIHQLPFDGSSDQD